MRINEIGEFKFIDRISGKFKDLLLHGFLGIGDDCAIIPYNNKEDYVITTDMLIEDIHFLKDRITPEQLGYKSLAVNLSDIAAMGGKPLGSYLSIGIPAETEVEYLDAVMKGYHDLSQKYQVQLLGGDTTKSKQYLVINIGVIGVCKKGEARLRSMAQSKDIICVTGFLGDSAGGLKVILNQLPETKDHLQLIRSHHLPEPHIKEGTWLAQHPEVHAMIDVSDGISSDLSHILRMSGKSAIVDLDKLPVSDTLKRVSSKQSWDIDKLATSGGEDYVLLCTVKAGDFEKLNGDFRGIFGSDLFPIGEITDGENLIKWIKNGKQVFLNQYGFDHFNS
ncbi:MAG: thiamine-phosphate kinase [Calditrichaceae bacterium]|nr:thiamine-phosphate kinase [Calditrichaceae bacterium]